MFDVSASAPRHASKVSTQGRCSAAVAAPASAEEASAGCTPSAGDAAALCATNAARTHAGGGSMPHGGAAQLIASVSPRRGAPNR